MSKLPPLNFSAHARLKDIVGRGLIISDDIAIIELIKNSKDAGASKVRIDFRQSGDTDATELVNKKPLIVFADDQGLFCVCSWRHPSLECLQRSKERLL